LRRAGCVTAKQYMWAEIIQHLLLPRLHFLARGATGPAPGAFPQARKERRRAPVRRDDGGSPRLLEWMAGSRPRRHPSHEDRPRGQVALVK
jgi:hypothetical protein